MSTLYRSALMALAITATFTAPLALAVTFTVNSTLDQPDDLTIPGMCHTAAGTCTLRAAVMQANRSSGVGATIVVPPGIYALTIPATTANSEADGDLNLTNPAVGKPAITIIGAGPGATFIDGNQVDRVFNVDDKRTATISKMTIRNGFYNPSGGVGYSKAVGGAGVVNSGLLTVDDVTISGNYSANNGGGIGNIGTLTVMNSTITQNIDRRDGGGIYNDGKLTVTDSVVSLNQAGGGGGGIENASFGTLTVTGSTIHSNSSANDGGGIENFGGLAAPGFTKYGDLVVINSTISQNSALRNGGGIFNYGTANVYSTSIAFNDADADADQGGGSGGGVFNVNALGVTFNLRNSLVAGNYVHNAPVYDDCTGTLVSYGRNLFWMATVCTVVNGTGSWGLLNALNTLGPLRDNGGPAPTHALLPGSSAIDGGDPALGCVGPDSNSLATDQRGFQRLAGARCDIGAFEYGALPPTADAIEYRHAAFDHYFVTSIADEITKLDNGTFAGWARTGQSFKVYADTTAGLAGVCRFFSTAFAPKSSHFYTPDAGECTVVKSNHDWQFEAVVFYMVNTDTGDCVPGTQRIYRLYNNGQGAAPNHRYTASLAIRSQMLAQGWLSEGFGPSGVIMCGPL